MTKLSQMPYLTATHQLLTMARALVLIEAKMRLVDIDDIRHR